MSENQNFKNPIPHKTYTAPKEVYNEINLEETKDENSQLNQFRQPISSREKILQNKRFREPSPERKDSLNPKNNSNSERTYKDIMLEQQREIEKMELLQKQKKEMKNNKKSEWDKLEEEENKKNKRISRWDLDETPILNSNSKNYLDVTPTPEQMQNKNNLDETPLMSKENFLLSTPTPNIKNIINMKTPLNENYNKQMNNFSEIKSTLDNLESMKIDKEILERNAPLTEEEINKVLPSQKDGYEIVPIPQKFQELLNNISELKKSNNNNSNKENFYQIPENEKIDKKDYSGLKEEDMKIFGSILNEVDESTLSSDEKKERNILTLLLKIKNGSPPIRKSALRQITEKSREFGAGPLFNQIIPLMMSPSLEDQERHLLVKVIDRILFKLDTQVAPYAHKILITVMPMLTDENSYARIEGREIISNLTKSAGLATMISVMRPDIDSPDENIRLVTSKAFAVVASSLGLNAILPFLKAICETKKSWLARDTGIKIIQQIAILMGCAVLPHLTSLVNIIGNGLKDEQQKIRTFTALAISALAEASYPYGIDAFKNVIRPLLDGIKQYKGKILAAYFKAVGAIIPLMNGDIAAKVSKLVIPILKRDFNNPDDYMKKIILKVLIQCLSSEGVEAKYVRENVFDEFFNCFWNRRLALDRKNYKVVIEATLEIAKKIQGAEVLSKIITNLKDENEVLRKMTLEAINNIIQLLGVSDIDKRLEQLLIDGLIFCFTQQTSDLTPSSNYNSANNIFLTCFGTVVNSLGFRIKPYITNICSTIQWRFNNKNMKIRQQSADLIVKLANSLKITGEENEMSKLALILNENLGEEYPEVLGSILAALREIVLVIGMHNMTPPIKDLLPRLTPILKNRNDKVEENVIKLIGLIADKGASYVTSKEWMRICFDLLEFLKAHRKNIRRATVNTFGYIAKAIGPQEVLMTLLNNLKVQERQIRVCTTVAIAIVSETCGPFTVIPALMNEYRVRELNTQNGVLKSFAFLFEYIGEMARDYIYSVVPLLQDALTERELVHRQIAASAIKHLAINVMGLNCEDALIDLLNYVWPNIFETSPHVMMAFTDAIEGLRCGLGVNRLMSYVLQGLFHPARRVRDVYWRIFNLFYVGAQDDLCSCYPTLPDENLERKVDEDFISGKEIKSNDEKFNKYAFEELNLFI